MMQKNSEFKHHYIACPVTSRGLQGQSRCALFVWLQVLDSLLHSMSHEL